VNLRIRYPLGEEFIQGTAMFIPLNAGLWISMLVLNIDIHKVIAYYKNTKNIFN